MTDTEGLEFRHVAVAGGGNMGCGIAAWMLFQGCNVVLVEENIQQVQEAETTIRNLVKLRMDRNQYALEDITELQSRLHCQRDWSNLEKIDLAIEAVTEDIGIKRNVLSQLENAVSNQTIMTSNTSSLEISRLAKDFTNPGRFMGTHFFYPVVVNPIVEVIRGHKTDPILARRVRTFFTDAGKTPIASQDVPGFVVNRYFNPYMNTAHWLMEELQVSGATIDDIAMKVFDSKQGPIEVSNWIGQSIVYQNQSNLKRLGSFYAPTKGLKRHSLSGEPIRLGKSEYLSEAQIKHVSETLLGCVFYCCLQILDEQICSANDIDLPAKLGLRFGKYPCALMDELGQQEVKRLVTPILENHSDVMPMSIEMVGQLIPVQGE